jgi:hypothetical protein
MVERKRNPATPASISFRHVVRPEKRAAIKRRRSTVTVFVSVEAAHLPADIVRRSSLIGGSLQPVDRLELTLTPTSRSTEMKTLLLAGTTVALLTAANLAPAMAQATKPVSQVVQWNRTLLVIVRTPGAQPATIHPTRSFAIMHGRPLADSGTTRTGDASSLSRRVLDNQGRRSGCQINTRDMARRNASFRTGVQSARRDRQHSRDG